MVKYVAKVDSIGYFDIDMFVSTLENWREKSVPACANIFSLPPWYFQKNLVTDDWKGFDQVEAPIILLKQKNNSISYPNPKRAKLISNIEKKEIDSKIRVLARFKNIILNLPQKSLLWDKNQTSDAEFLWKLTESCHSKTKSPGLAQNLKFWDWLVTECGKLEYDPFELDTRSCVELWDIKTMSSKMAADTFRSKLSWAEKHIGAKVSLSDQGRKTIALRQIHFGAARGQAPSPHFSDLLHLEFLCSNPGTSDAIKIVAAASLLCCWSSLRLVSLQRLTLTKFDFVKRIVYGFLPSIKNEKKDAPSKPVFLEIPMLSLLKEDDLSWVKILEKYNTDRAFLVPNISGPLASSRAIIHCDEQPSNSAVVGWLNLLFSISSKYNRFLDASLPAHEVDTKLSGHSMRTLLPSVADVVNLDDGRSRLLGRWRPGRDRDGTINKRYSRTRLLVTRITIRALHRVILCALKRNNFICDFEDVSSDDLSFGFKKLTIDNVEKQCISSGGSITSTNEVVPSLSPPILNSSSVAVESPSSPEEVDLSDCSGSIFNLESDSTLGSESD